MVSKLPSDRVFFVYVYMRHWQTPGAPHPGGLAKYVLTRLVFRTPAAVITVPIDEELALRRFLSTSDFGGFRIRQPLTLAAPGRGLFHRFRPDAR